MSNASLQRRLPSSFSQVKKIHILGVCGTLMGAFAVFLKRRGIDVSGSDQNIYPPMSDVLRSAGVTLCEGYSPENLKRVGNPDFVVVGNVISASNPEMIAVRESGWTYASLPEVMEELLLPETRNLVVAGTHGKTTTSTLLSHVLVQAGEDPSYFFGGVSLDLPHSFHVAGLDKGRPFVLEGDEYDTAFWDKVPKFYHYRPDDVLLTSVEFDHADIYRDLEHVKSVFRELARKIRAGGRLIACMDYDAVAEVCELAKVPVIRYGSEATQAAEYFPTRIQVGESHTKFEIHRRSGGRTEKPTEKLAELELGLPGVHNALNATAVWLECRELGVPAERVAEAFRSYRGVKRRQEVRGDVNGVVVIDDFAHHPTAVRETLKALRGKYAARRLLTVFEPRSATSRRKVFQEDYVDALGLADRAFVAEPFDQTKIPEGERFSSRQLVDRMSDKGFRADVFGGVEDGVKRVASACEPGDVVAVLSNGGFGGFIPKLIEELKRRG